MYVALNANITRVRRAKRRGSESSIKQKKNQNSWKSKRSE